MKVRISIVLFFLLTLFLNVNGQLSWGLRGGVTSSNIQMSDNSGGGHKLEYSKGTFGWHAGLIGQLKVSKLFVQPELLFSTAKFDIKYDNDLGEQKIRKIDLPIMVGFKLGAIKLQAGPVGTWLLASKVDLPNDKSFDQTLNSSTIGYQAGIGLELSSLMLDFKYEGNLSKLGDEVKFGTTTFQTDQRMSQFIFSIGYLFK